jgi:hypothetical protein
MAMERGQRSKYMKRGVQGMGYVYAPEDIGKKGGKNSNIPIVNVPPSALMTSECMFLAGPGEKVRGEKNYKAL